MFSFFASMIIIDPSQSMISFFVSDLSFYADIKPTENMFPMFRIGVSCLTRSGAVN